MSSCSSSPSSSFWVSASQPVLAPMVKGKKFSKVFFTGSENEEDVTPCFMVLSVGDLVVVTSSVEMSDLESRWKWQNLGLVLPG